MDRQNYDSQDRASIAASLGKNRPPWLKTRLTGDDVHSVQKMRMDRWMASNMQIVCYPSQGAKVFRPQFHQVSVR